MEADELEGEDKVVLSNNSNSLARFEEMKVE